jgi:exopolyphosphatase/guanosine-5'-triphosphate,3'-diphosphate pyrophosphatase
MNRLAAIDIGTNSAKVTVADVDEGGKLTVVDEASEITRLGKGVDKTRRLDDAAMARTLAAVERFTAMAREAGAERIAVAGTSALRDAENGGDFLGQVKAKTGLDIEIVTGDREANLAYLGVRSEPALPAGDGPLIVFDIGGGSTELILGRGASVERHKSVDVGAVRLTERLLTGDSPSDAEIGQAADTAREMLRQFTAPDDAAVLVGVGGTVVNVAGILGVKAGAALSREDAADVLARLRAVPLAERKTIAGLEPERADVIVAGVVILLAVLGHLGAREFRVSKRGVRYGLIADAAATAAD